MVTLEDIMILSSCAFLGCICLGITGFGGAIVFLFIWQIAVIFGYENNFKYAVFVQALSQFCAQFFLVYTVPILEHADKNVLYCLVPSMLIFTPIGQITVDVISTKYIEMTIGSLMILITVFELFHNSAFSNRLQRCCALKISEVEELKLEGNPRRDEENCEKGPPRYHNWRRRFYSFLLFCHDKERREEDTKTKNGLTGYNDACHTIFTESDYAERNEKLKYEKEGEKNEEAYPRICNVTKNESFDSNEESHTEFVNVGNKTGKCNISSTTQKAEHGCDERPIETQSNVLGPRAKMWTLLAGAASGFFGGLCGITGPPLMIYFLYLPHQISLTTESQRAIGACVVVVNTVTRAIFYLVMTFIFDSENSFLSSDWVLYVLVITTSFLGIFVGGYLFHLMKDSKSTIRGIIFVILALCGISLLFSSFSLASRK